MEKRSARLSVRLRPQAKRQLQRLVARHGWRSLSDWIESAISVVWIGGMWTGRKYSNESDPAGVGAMTASHGAKAPAGSPSKKDKA